MHIFERATRQKLRFISTVGMLTLEQLWDLPLKHSRAANLNDVARRINSELKELGEESFVDDAPAPEKTELTLKLDVVKRIIEVKKADVAAAETRAAAADQRRMLLEAKAAKQGERFSSMTEEEIDKALQAIGS